jgi:hypothetical protein
MTAEQPEKAAAVVAVNAGTTVEAGHQQWADETQSSVSGIEVAVEPAAPPDDVAPSGLVAAGRDPAQRTPTLVD